MGPMNRPASFRFQFSAQRLRRLVTKTIVHVYAGAKIIGIGVGRGRVIGIGLIGIGEGRGRVIGIV